MPRTLYLIDGHAQIYRAYYAPFVNLRAPSGEPTRATHVFCQMLLNLVRGRRPDYLALVLDTSDETVFRKDIYPEYKAHRQPPPEDLPIQSQRIVQLMTALGVPVLRLERFEADDLMATLAERLAGPDLHVYLVSRDKDLEQLLGPQVVMYDPTRDEVITPQKLFEQKGWWPQQAIDAQILTGDSVDNVPGVAGIGPKTAARFLQQYGSARGVVEHADELTPKLRENVLAFAPQMELVRQLVMLRRDVPFEFDLERAACTRLAWDALRPTLAELGLRRLLEQWPRGAGATREPDHQVAPPPGIGVSPVPAGVGGPPVAGGPTVSPVGGAQAAGEAPPPASARAVPGVPAAAPADLRQRLSQPDGGDYRLVNTPEAFDELAARLAAREEFALDTETTSVNPIDAELVGLSFAWEVGRGYFVPVRSSYGPTIPLDQVRARLGPLLADERTRKVGQNLKYDLIVLRQAGLPVRGPLFDTMIAAFVLDPTRTSYGLDPLVAGLLAHRMIPITDLIGKGRDQLGMDQVPLSRIAEYAAEDADYTWRLKELFAPRLAPAGLDRLFFETEMPLLTVLTDMEYHGIRLDLDFLGQMGRELAARTAEIEQEVHRLAGTVFNLDSPRQLAEVLFDQLGLRVVRTTKTGRSTDAHTLETLARETAHPLPTLLLEYRELQKLRGTYVEALPRALSRRTGRIHTSFHQTGTVTGRLSSSEPNLQNIPVRTAIGREIRRAFVPRGPDEVLLVADYSQVELRVLAHFCRDEGLCRAFAADHDIHASVAAEVNGVPLAAVTSEMRARAKAVNFGLIYGQGAHGLAQTTGMSRTEAQHFIDRYFQRYPRIRAFVEQCVANARRDGFVRTILGRRRPLPEIDSRNPTARAQAERLAVNTVIQGSAADLIKMAMIRLHQRIEQEKWPLRMLLQVHDELVCEGPRDQAPALGELLRDVMSHALPLAVPLKVDVAWGANWLEAK